jgi:hypothetical protein
MDVGSKNCIRWTPSAWFDEEQLDAGTCLRENVPQKSQQHFVLTHCGGDMERVGQGKHFEVFQVKTGG